LIKPSGKPLGMLNVIKSLTDISNNVIAVLNTYAETDEVRGNTCFTKLLV
jgi:hypothetical protein